MTNSVDKSLESERSFEALLGRATPRPAPSAEDSNRAREAVYAEWQSVTRQGLRRRRLVSLAAAATVIVAVALVINLVRAPATVAIQVATIGKSVGSIYVYTDSSPGQVVDDLSTISAGQTIRTESASSVALDWGEGGSLRIAENSRINFDSENSIELVSGLVYFDSYDAPAGSFEIRSPLGVVTHVGTQYMVGVDNEQLAVSVRDGIVEIEGNTYDADAKAGQRVVLEGSARPVTLNFPGYGDAWRWIEATSTKPALDGKSTYEFLIWVARETGLELDISGVDTVTAVNTTLVSGADNLSDDPRTALRQWLAIIDLHAEIDNGIIRVTDTGANQD